MVIFFFFFCFFDAMVNLSGFYVGVMLFIAISTTSCPSFTQSVVPDALQNLKEKTSHDCAKEGIFLI